MALACSVASTRARLLAPSVSLALLCGLACATPTLRERAETGDVEAQIELGDVLLGTAEAPPQAMPAAPGEPELESGSGSGSAESWYRRAAEQGDARAQFKLAELYYSGEGGVEIDYGESARWAHASAEQGYAPAQSFLGGLYRLGRGVLQNYAVAVRWYRPAAEQGDAGAQFYMGTAYDFGAGGLDPDPQEALRWYVMAADQGWERAQLNAGLLYLHEDPTIRDEVQAFKWLLLAAALGNQRAYTMTNQMLQQMTREQVIEGGELAAEWRREHGLAVDMPKPAGVPEAETDEASPL